MNEWMQKESIEEIIMDQKTLQRDIFDGNEIKKLLFDNKKNNDKYDFNGKKIWMLVNIELWIREFIDK